MNGAQRVLAEIMAWRPGLRSIDMAHFLGVSRRRICVWRSMDNMSDSALLLVHDRTGIPVRKLLGLRACTRQPATGKKPKPRVRKPLSPMTSRERFEMWAKLEGMYTRRSGESYFDATVVLCWKTWQAARNQPGEQHAHHPRADHGV